MKRIAGIALVLSLCSPLLAPLPAAAGGKVSIDETKWISLGIGGRVSFATIEDASPNSDEWSKDFNVNNARIYINGQAHQYLKFEFNTDCVFCGNSGLEEFVLLDAIAKIEINPYFNVWAGRLIVPAERQELNGPFYSSTYDPYKTPFFSSDYSIDFGAGGAGVYARDQGVNIWGAAGPEGAFQYVFGVFQGLQSSSAAGPNQDDNPLVAGRIAYNFLNVEKNPGYYTSGTYYGSAGDVFTVATAFQYQEDGSGSLDNPGDFFGLAADVLFEKVLSGAGVFTLTGEYKYFDADYDEAAFADPDAFLMFDGDAFWVAGLYLFEPKVWIGQFQPYFRYTGVYVNDSSDRDEYEAGVNYVIDGHNARISLFYQYGDIATKGLNYAPDADGDDVSAVKLAIQIQI